MAGRDAAVVAARGWRPEPQRCRRRHRTFFRAGAAMVRHHAAGRRTVRRKIRQRPGHRRRVETGDGRWRQSLRESVVRHERPRPVRFRGLVRAGRADAAWRHVQRPVRRQYARRDAPGSDELAAHARVRPQPRTAGALAGADRGAAGTAAEERRLQRADARSRPRRVRPLRTQARRTQRARTPAAVGARAVRPVDRCGRGGLRRNRAVRRLPQGVRRTGECADAGACGDPGRSGAHVRHVRHARPYRSRFRAPQDRRTRAPTPTPARCGIRAGEVGAGQGYACEVRTCRICV